MARKSFRSVQVPTAMHGFVTDRVRRGRFRSADEAIVAGLRLLQEEESLHDAVTDRMRTQIEEGHAQAERGMLRDGEVFFDELMSELKPRHRKPRARRRST